MLASALGVFHLTGDDGPSFVFVPLCITAAAKCYDHCQLSTPTFIKLFPNATHEPTLSANATPIFPVAWGGIAYAGKLRTDMTSEFARAPLL
ncbi:hypothetical protein ONZ51_g7880 [Trametes cubensis]|uniref:Uncharacterized protein n=1 Tax=Trametes cubensis TaxID=1111947 RepID=A0AAD7TPB9_9APHY|nr:hypothetical protein ONZ51_g7880 [Trametes cubensis]